MKNLSFSAKYFIYRYQSLKRLKRTTYGDKHINHHPGEKQKKRPQHMVWWLPVLGMHFKRWKWLPEEKNDQKINFLYLLWNDRAVPLREDDVASLKVQLVYLVIGFGLWWCIKVRCGGLIGVAESFGGHGKSVRRCVQIRGPALDLNTVWILPPFSSIQCELISQFSLFSMYENRGPTSDLNIFVPRRNDTSIRFSTIFD